MSQRPTLPVLRIAVLCAGLAWVALSYRTRTQESPTPSPATPPVWAVDHYTGSGRGAGKPMPAAPFPGQKTPPCSGAQVAINGGCWYRVKPEPGALVAGATCTEDLWEHAGMCYLPVRHEKRPVSLEPQP